MPDAVSYATRLALAMLAAYFVSFLIQLDSASSAGACVGIVMQASRGMAVSKAFYRTLGTLAGGAAALLRDFRAYGAVLAGYTVAVISVGQVSNPANVLLTTLDRVAAILIGIVCVALVNAVFIVAFAHEYLLAELRRHLREARDTALAVLDNGARPLRDVSLDRAADLLALRTDAAYASAELADALLVERAASLARDHACARLAVDATAAGELAGVPRRVRIPSEPDRAAAVLNALRAMTATGLGAVLCVAGGDPTTTLLLIQLAAFVALLGLTPNPSAAAAAFLPALPFGAALAGGVVFGLLPLSSGFGPFALAVGPVTFAIGLAARHPRTAPYAPGLLIYFTVLLSPSNVQGFNLLTFANLVLQLAVASVLTGVAFRLVLPVDPWRLLHVADRVVRSLRRALQGAGTDGGHWQPSLAYDRLAQGLLWARLRRPRPHLIVTRLCLLAEADAAATHAWHGLRDAAAAAPDLRPLARAGKRGWRRSSRTPWMLPPSHCWPIPARRPCPTPCCGRRPVCTGRPR